MNPLSDQSALVRRILEATRDAGLLYAYGNGEPIQDVDVEAVRRLAFDEEQR